MAWMKPLVKSGWLSTDALIPLVLENGITDGGDDPEETEGE